MQTNEHIAIRIENLSFSYNGLPVLDGVDLRIRERDFLAIVGPNGGGKTTLLKLILGLLTPERGTVAVFGQPPAKVRSRLGYMPQHVHLDPLFPVTVADVVLMGRLCREARFGFFRRTDRQKAAEALDLVDLAGLGNRPFAELSGGQRQRVLIARALVSDPEILLLDEPTANVDAAVETELFETLRRLNRQMTVVLVSHDLGFVSTYVRTVACVNRRVVVHPTSDITGRLIQEIYGCDVRMVRHDARTQAQNPKDERLSS